MHKENTTLDDLNDIVKRIEEMEEPAQIDLAKPILKRRGFNVDNLVKGE